LSTATNRSGPADGDAPGWAVLFALLIAHGHSHAEILDYTLNQFEAYVQAAERRDRSALRSQLLAARAGQWGNAEQFQGLLRALQN